MTTELLEKNEIYLKKTKSLKDDLEHGFLLLAERLFKIRTERLFLPTYEAFWCYTEEELKLSESTCSRLINVFQRFILEWGVSPEKVISIGGWNEAYLISKVAKNKKEAEDMLDKYALMPPSEARKDMAELKAGEHCHNWQEIHIRQCTVCGCREKIYNDK